MLYIHQSRSNDNPSNAGTNLFPGEWTHADFYNAHYAYKVKSMNNI